MTTTIPTNLGLAGAAALNRPRYLVSFSFEAPDADAAQAATDALEHVMRTEDAVPDYHDLAFFKPVEVATNVPPVSSSKKILRLDPAEVSSLMAALMEAIEACDDTLDDGETRASYVALADKLTVAHRDGIA